MQKDEFIKTLSYMIGEANLTFNFKDEILIEEEAKSGEGKIYLDISNYTLNEKFFFVKIEHKKIHNISTMKNQNHCDGIVLKVDLNLETIDIFIFELKKQIHLNKFEKDVRRRWISAYLFMNFLKFNDCFSVNYKFILAYEKDSFKLNFNRNDNFKLYSAFKENKKMIPLKLPFCKDKYFNFEKRVFSDKFAI